MVTEWWEENLSPGPFSFPYFGVDIDGEIGDGVVTITHFEVGGLDDRYNERGEGRGSFVLTLLIETACSTPDIHRIDISIGDVDGRSKRFLEKFSFEHTGESVRDGRPVIHAKRPVHSADR